MTLAIDIETFSSNDLKTCGVSKYIEAADFSILMLAYAYDDGPVEIIDLEVGEPLSEHIIVALFDTKTLKTAHNAAFEINCINKYLEKNTRINRKLPTDQWSCTMVKSAMMGLPFSLEQVGKVLNVTEQKDSEGKALIRYFSISCKPTKANGGRTRNMPSDDPEKWEKYKQYCRQDVTTERAIRARVDKFQIPDFEKRLWDLDQKINTVGVRIDTDLVRNAMLFDVEQRKLLTTEAIELTGLDNPNSAAQLKKWLSTEMPLDSITTLKKTDLPDLIESAKGYTGKIDITRVLEIRAEMSKTSIKKYAAMVAALCADNRVRGLLQFYGANRTGRWAGRLVQVQNLPKNSLKDLHLCRELVAAGDLEILQTVFGSVPDRLSQLVRTAFIPSEGCRFIVADFSAIEARVIAWLAQEKWRLDVFATHGKIYEASGAAMFKVPIEAVTKTSDYRAKAKVAELALGYQGSVSALRKTGAVTMGVCDEAIKDWEAYSLEYDKTEHTKEDKKKTKDEAIDTELKGLVNIWRAANPNIVQCWYKIGDCAIDAVRSPGEKIYYNIKPNGTKELFEARICFQVDRGILFITLPSSRKLAYIRPKLIKNKFDQWSIRYEGLNQETKQWGHVDTYGGKLVENITQAIARDCLAESLLKVDAVGYNIVMHVHDEIVCDQPVGNGSLEKICAMMGEPVSWAPTLPLKAEGFETLYYKKD